MLLLLSDLYGHSNINNIENYLFEADLYQNKFWKVRLWCLGSEFIKITFKKEMSHALLEWKLKMQVSSCWLHPLANVSLSDHFLAVIVMKEREVVGSPRFAWALRCRKTAGNIYIYINKYIGSRWCCWPLCPGWLRLGQCSEFLLRPPGEKSALSCPVCEVAADTVQTPDSWSSVGLNISWPSCLVSPPPLPILYLCFVLLPQDLALWCNWSD